MIDFVGIGAQKSGTSWAYTCLYEHPETCMPQKEIHFFSRPRYGEGIAWYEDQFKRCAEGKQRGEWSTSYLYSKEAAERIHAHYPNVKLLAILRNPLDRAYSQYRNAIRAGEIGKETDFETYRKEEKSALEQGLYAEQLERYLKFFPREQMLILIYEDIKKDPVAFMRRIYEFLGIDSSFVSSMVHTEVNVGRTPTVVGIDRVLHHIAEFLRRHGLDRLVHTVKRSGIPERIRKLNTSEGRVAATPSGSDEALREYFRNDVSKLSEFTGRDLLAEWRINT